MNEAIRLSAKKPWYREPWPWYLMAGPFIVVVAGFATAWLAITTSDGLVTEDYYKQGQAIDQTLARNRLAEALGLEVRAHFTADGVAVRVAALSSSSGEAFQAPARIMLSLSHPTRAGLDQQVSLELRDGQYVGSLRVPASGHWLILVEDEAQTWRILGNVQLPATGDVVIGGQSGKPDS